jgi:hypothetical protein
MIFIALGRAPPSPEQPGKRLPPARTEKGLTHRLRLRPTPEPITGQARIVEVNNPSDGVNHEAGNGEYVKLNRLV